jgi:hypothetical protein
MEICGVRCTSKSAQNARQDHSDIAAARSMHMPALCPRLSLPKVVHLLESVVTAVIGQQRHMQFLVQCVPEATGQSRRAEPKPPSQNARVPPFRNFNSPSFHPHTPALRTRNSCAPADHTHTREFLCDTRASACVHPSRNRNHGAV